MPLQKSVGMLALPRCILASACLLCLSSPPAARATTILIEWTPHRIFIAADTLGVIESTNKLTGQITRKTATVVCKLMRAGDIFFTMSGTVKSDLLKINMLELLGHAARTPGTIRQKLTLYQNIARESAIRLLKDNLAAAREDNVISALFISPKDHSFGLKDYVIEEGKIKDKPEEVYGGEDGKMSLFEFLSMGTFEFVEILADRPELKTKRGMDLLVASIDAQIAREQIRKIPRVGKPITVLEITNGRASWVKGYQEPCPDIP
jgi:hypothetical protein